MLIGCSRQPSCLSPSGSKRTDSGIAYYRLYRQNLTYLYFRGFDIRAIVRFQERLQLELRKFPQFYSKIFTFWFSFYFGVDHPSGSIQFLAYAHFDWLTVSFYSMCPFRT